MKGLDLINNLKRSVRLPGTGWLLVMVFLSVNKLYSQENVDSALSCILIRHSIKVDLVPFYSVLFDTRKQVRVGIEYQVENYKKHFWGVHLDAGMYDDYTYFKYYDFFNQNTGLYFKQQDVKAYGFHLMPAWHYRLAKCGSNKKVQCHIGVTADINAFEKIVKNYHSQTSEKNRYTFKQGRVGLGVHGAAAWRLASYFRMELKTILVARVFMLQSESGMKDIKPYKALWFDDRQRFWLIPQLSVCYDF
jgi:hypothetical protein